jgi:5-methylcytosine-specific restriction endonuclease McrA
VAIFHFNWFAGAPAQLRGRGSAPGSAIDYTPRMIHRAEFTPAVKQQALLRAAYRCERCGTRTSLEFHHRGHRADRSLFNCEMLCVACHQLEHAKRMCAAGSTQRAAARAQGVG